LTRKSPTGKKFDFDYIPIAQLELWEDTNVRKTNTYIDIEELAENIGKIGVQLPLLVTPKDRSRYLVISGQRRLIAAKKAGFSEVPCVIRQNIKPIDARIASFSENIYRLPMNDDDKSEAVLMLVQKLKNEKEVAERLGVSVTTVKSYLGYAAIDDRLKEYVRQRQMNKHTATKIFRKFKQAPKLMLQVAEEYARAPKGTKSAVSEALDRASSAESVEQLRGHIKEAKSSHPYKIRLPSVASNIISDLAKQSGTTPADIIAQIIQRWVELFKEGKVFL